MYAILLCYLATTQSSKSDTANFWADLHISHRIPKCIRILHSHKFTGTLNSFAFGNLGKFVLIKDEGGLYVNVKLHFFNVFVFCGPKLKYLDSWRYRHQPKFLSLFASVGGKSQ